MSLRPFLAILLLFGTTVLAEPGNGPSLFEGSPRVVTKGHQFAEGMAFDADGHFYFTDVPAGELFRIDAVTVHRSDVADDGSLGEFRPAYRLATGDDGRGMLDGMVVLPSGRLLIGTAEGIQLVPALSGANRVKPVVVPPFDGRPRCNYVRLSPDGRWLYAAFAADIVKVPVREGALD